MEKIKCDCCKIVYKVEKDTIDRFWNICPKCDEANTRDLQEDYDKIMAYESTIEMSNVRLLNAIEKVTSKSFTEAVKEIIKENEEHLGKIEIVKQPTGAYQTEYYHSRIGIWVHQWSVGMDCDSFSGFIYIKVKRKSNKDKYIRIPYYM